MTTFTRQSNRGEVHVATPTVAELGTVVQTLRDWQSDNAAWQLHPGDIGWFWRTGAQETADAVRVWTRNSEVVAIGLVDGARLLRVTTAPETRQDLHVAARLVADISNTDAGVLPAGGVSVEAPTDAVLQASFTEAGWLVGEAFTALQRDLSEEVEDPGIRVHTVTASEAEAWSGILRSAFGTPSPTVSRWESMSASPVYNDAVSLVAYDGEEAAAAVTVWSAGPGRPGLIEPMGVHEIYRGRGLGRAITIAAAATLRSLGASSARVYTHSSNAAGIATYQGAGFSTLSQVRDLVRPA